MTHPRRTSLAALADHYGDVARRARINLVISIGESASSYNVGVIGVVRDKRHIIVAAPTTSNNALIAVVKGQLLTCRWFNAMTAFRFRAGILKLGFEPVPLLHLQIQNDIERKAARRLPRALVCFSAELRLPEPTDVLVVDLSVGGARLALPNELSLQTQRHCQLVLQLQMINRSYPLLLDCTLTSVMGTNDPAHSDIQFIGVEFRELSETDLLTLHACVQEHLVHEADWLTHLLS